MAYTSMLCPVLCSRQNLLATVLGCSLPRRRVRMPHRPLDEPDQRRRHDRHHGPVVGGHGSHAHATRTSAIIFSSSLRSPPELHGDERLRAPRRLNRIGHRPLRGLGHRHRKGRRRGDAGLLLTADRRDRPKQLDPAKDHPPRHFPCHPPSPIRRFLHPSSPFPGIGRHRGWKSGLPVLFPLGRLIATQKHGASFPKCSGNVSPRSLPGPRGSADHSRRHRIGG